MPHFNHRASNFKYKDYKALAIPNLCVRRVDIVEYLGASGVNDTYCLLRDRVTTEQFKVPLSEVQIIHHLDGEVICLCANGLSAEGHHHV